MIYLYCYIIKLRTFYFFKSEFYNYFEDTVLSPFYFFRSTFFPTQKIYPLT